MPALLLMVCWHGWGHRTLAQVAPADPGTGQVAEASARPLHYSPQNAFTIPFTVDSSIQRPLEVQLFVSTDQGNSWQLYARERPGLRQFVFRTAEDGEYWFASRTIDLANRATPSGVLNAELRVEVDTVQPTIDLTAQPPAEQPGTIVIEWQTFDRNLAAETLRLEYQRLLQPQWIPVSVPVAADAALQSTFAGNSTISPGAGTGPIVVRCEVRDRAGNLAVAHERVHAEPSTGPGPTSAVDGTTPGSGPPPASDATIARWPSRQELEASGAEGARTAARPAPAQPIVLPTDDPGTAGPGPTSSNGSPFPASPSPVREPVAQQPVTRDPAEDLPQMITTPRFVLDYDVEGTGPGGVADVELWVTQDDGRQWHLMTRDADRESPVDVEVPRDGIYGFRIVVIGRNGLVSPRPAAGEPADLWVGIDTVAPAARLAEASFGTGHRAGHLVIRWNSHDDHLASRPVTLAYAEQSEGPWVSFAAGLPNTGEYVWAVDSQLPSQVYLRLQVRDVAGNVATEFLPQPVSLRGLAPRARIRSVRTRDQ